MRQIFISYINRSGSTYLSQHLDSYKDVFVSIEAGIFSYLIRQPFILTNQDNSNFQKEVIKDNKLQNWEVSKENILNWTNKINIPYDITDFINFISTEIYKKHKSSIIVFKNPGFHKVFSLLDKKLSCHLIFISRDPRAIYNSQLVSNNSLSKKKMANNILQFAYYYYKTNRDIDLLINHENVTRVDYEDMILRFNIFSSFMEERLGLGDLIKKNIPYSNRIPTAQKSLHKNLEKGLLYNRVNAYETELNNFDYNLLSKIFNLPKKDHLKRTNEKRIKLLFYFILFKSIVILKK